MSEVIRSLAEQIKAEHVAVREAAQRGIMHALKCGDLLLEAKAKVDHGQWLPWLENECGGISERMAQRYMRVARHRLEIEAKSDSVSDLTLTGALKIVGREDEPPPTLIVANTKGRHRSTESLALIKCAREKIREPFGDRAKIVDNAWIRHEERGAWVAVWLWVPR